MAGPKIAKADASAGPLSFNGQTVRDVDLRFFAALLANMKNNPDINWDETAKLLNLKDSKCAKERWRQIRIKFGWNPEPNTPRTAGGRKKNMVAGSSTPSTPSRDPYKITKRTGRVGTPAGGAAAETQSETIDLTDPDIAVFEDLSPLKNKSMDSQKAEASGGDSKAKSKVKIEPEVDPDLQAMPEDDYGEV